ncbi:MAG: TrkH family potassium uptake protein, partial [Phycisphaerales bacterium]|nr:TrkH family potassium uptake protein [Phycisphaerales bacterium]
MKVRRLINQIGLLLGALGVAQGLVGGYGALASTREAAMALLIGALVCAVPGIVMFMLTHERTWQVERREAIFLMPVSWIVASIGGAVPFFAWGMLMDGPTPWSGVVDAMFESTSAFTTTGASVVRDPSRVPGALLLWRALAAWIGGLATVLLFVAVLPTLGVGRHSHVEVTSDQQVHEHIRSTGRQLVRLYGAITLVAALIFVAFGDHPFDAGCHALSLVATCAFRTSNEAPLASVAIASMLVMFLGSLSFVVLLRLFKGRWRQAWTDP